MTNKWPTTIAKELVNLASGDPWKAYKSAALAAGHPILLGEEKKNGSCNTQNSTRLTRQKPHLLESWKHMSWICSVHRVDPRQGPQRFPDVVLTLERY
ncbi:hypothetical protein J3R83DRAFT_7286 [Lanmaoa asiatica]|nr:hypothetical protein J3R83DRAFT_7286 [Lanmaoa asiatica]